MNINNIFNDNISDFSDSEPDINEIIQNAKIRRQLLGHPDWYNRRNWHPNIRKFENAKNNKILKEYEWFLI